MNTVYTTLHDLWRSMGKMVPMYLRKYNSTKSHPWETAVNHRLLSIHENLFLCILMQWSCDHLSWLAHNTPPLYLLFQNTYWLLFQYIFVWIKKMWWSLPRWNGKNGIIITYIAWFGLKYDPAEGDPEKKNYSPWWK